MAHVADLMSWEPLVAVAHSTAVDAAMRCAHAAGIHHLLVKRKDDLVGILCTCDLREAAGDELVSRHMSTHLVTVGADASVAVAADRMRRHGVGALPVLSTTGQVIGILTASDFVRAGMPLSITGKRVCTTCGGTHHVRPVHGAGDVAFCLECLEKIPERDLGGQD